MPRGEWVELTSLCLIYRDDEILLQNRLKRDWQGYTLPGGHIEPGESIVEGTIREMREETGLEVRDLRLCGVKQFPIEGGRYLVLLYKTNRFSGQLRDSQEGPVEWVKVSELYQYNTVSDLKELLDVMLRDDLSEFQYVIEQDQWIAKLY